MAFTYHRDDARQRITVTTDREITLEDVRAIVDRQVADRAWSYALFYDSRETTVFPPPVAIADIIAQVRAYAFSLGRRGPVAIVTQSPSVFGLARQYGVVESDVGPVGFFADRSAAESWLEQTRGDSR